MGWPLSLLEQGVSFQSIPKIGATSPKQEQHSCCRGQRPAALMCSVVWSLNLAPFSKTDGVGLSGEGIFCSQAAVLGWVGK